MASLQGYEFPPGFRFHPTDQELIAHYLTKKVTSSLTPSDSIIADVDLYKFDPWDLPGKAMFGEGEWFFFSPRDRKYPNGGRPNRASRSGYWKATGVDKPILAGSGGSHDLCLGVKKALVFYKGRPPKGVKTDWIMQEYRLINAGIEPHREKGSMRLDDWVLCRVRQKMSQQQQADDDGDRNTTLINPAAETPRSNWAALLEENDGYQMIAACLLSSGQDDDHGDGAGNISAGCGGSFKNNTGADQPGFYGLFGDDEPPPLHQALAGAAMKRKLFFGGDLEELFSRPPPTKKMISGGDYYNMALENTDLMDQTFADYLI